MNKAASKRIVRISYFMLIFLILQTIMFSVNICPPDKNPTEITIEHSRHPQNIPIGVYDNSIDVTIHLNAIDRNTQKKIPLANKEILLELTIGSKFITKNPSGDFVLSDEPAPFPVNTTENGIISFTIYTQPPLLENVTDPRKISYAITASYTPKPREPLLGSTKTERYVPGIFPVISMAACGPLFIIFAVLIAAMFAAGKNPFGLLDFTRVAFKAPTIARQPLTIRSQMATGKGLGGTTIGIITSSGKFATSKTISKIAKEYAVGPYLRRGLYEVGAFLDEQAEKAMTTKGGFIKRALGKLASIPLALVGKPIKTATGIPKEKVEEAAQATGQRKIVVFEAPPPPAGLTWKDIKATFLSSLAEGMRQSLASLGYRPWSYSAARGPAMTLEQKLSKEEQKDLREELKRRYNYNQMDEKKKKEFEENVLNNVNENGLVGKGREWLARNLGIDVKRIPADGIPLLNAMELANAINKGVINRSYIDAQTGKLIGELKTHDSPLNLLARQNGVSVDIITHMLEGDVRKLEEDLKKLENNPQGKAIALSLLNEITVSYIAKYYTNKKDYDNFLKQDFNKISKIDYGNIKIEGLTKEKTDELVQQIKNATDLAKVDIKIEGLSKEETKKLVQQIKHMLDLTEVIINQTSEQRDRQRLAEGKIPENTKDIMEKIYTTIPKQEKTVEDARTKVETARAELKTLEKELSQIFADYDKREQKQREIDSKKNEIRILENTLNKEKDTLKELKSSVEDIIKTRDMLITINKLNWEEKGKDKSLPDGPFHYSSIFEEAKTVGSIFLDSQLSTFLKVKAASEEMKFDDYTKEIKEEVKKAQGNRELQKEMNYLNEKIAGPFKEPESIDQVKEEIKQAKGLKSTISQTTIGIENKIEEFKNTTPEGRKITTPGEKTKWDEMTPEEKRAWQNSLNNLKSIQNKLETQLKNLEDAYNKHNETNKDNPLKPYLEKEIKITEDIAYSESGINNLREKLTKEASPVSHVANSIVQEFVKGRKLSKETETDISNKATNEKNTFETKFFQEVSWPGGVKVEPSKQPGETKIEPSTTDKNKKTNNNYGEKK